MPRLTGWTVGLEMKKPFYGWVIVGVIVLIGVTEAGVFQNVLSVFLKPMTGEFGWSRAMVTGTMALGSVCGGLISPFIGPILDRHGPRLVTFLGVVILSAGLIAMSSLKYLWQFYIFFSVGRMVAVGVLSLAVSVTISNWFIRQRGRALALGMFGGRAGSAILPPFVQFIILSRGWRVAWASLGGVVLLLSGLPSLLFLRRRPEDIGLWPDGKPPLIEKNEHKDEPGERNFYKRPGHEWTRAEAVRTPTFWILTALNCLLLFGGSGINFHVFPFITDQGLEPATAVFIISTISIFGALGGVIWGFLAERYETRILLILVFFFSGLLFISFFFFVRASGAGAEGIRFLYILGGAYGICLGGRGPLVSIFWAETFGRASLGAISGFATPFKMSANALGPLFGAFCFDLLGNYTASFYIFVAAFLLAGLLGLRLKNPPIPSGLTQN